MKTTSAKTPLVTSDRMYRLLKNDAPITAVREFDGSNRMLRMLVILRYVIRVNGMFVPVMELDDYDTEKWIEKIDGMSCAGSPSSCDTEVCNQVNLGIKV
jgi:hypothetical protein